MIAKACKLHVIFWRSAEQVIHLDTNDPRDQHLNRLEEALSKVSAPAEMGRPPSQLNS